MKYSSGILFCAFLLLSCSNNKSGGENKSQNKINQEQKADSNSALSKYNLESENPKIIYLPTELTEISGIVMSPEGRLFAQQDEKGIVYELNPNTGEIIKSFAIGNPVIKDDFEDIAYANNKFYLVTSSGDIYEFNEGENGESVDYKIHSTGLQKKNDVEGLCYDQQTNSLLLALKGPAGADAGDDKYIYSFSLNDMKLDQKARFILPAKEIKKNFNPSGIQKNIRTGTYFIITANGNEIAEINNGGKILGKQKLLPEIHKQPEGITFDKDFNLYISNEGKSGKGYIVVYSFIK